MLNNCCSFTIMIFGKASSFEVLVLLTFWLMQSIKRKKRKMCSYKYVVDICFHGYGYLM